ncbi:MAG TPA: glycine/sarcosine/betaine reductase component B subunit [Chloroflexota bacterium]|jgi:glycine reductase
MRLELANFPVDEVAFGTPTRLEGTRLIVDRDDLAAAVAQPALTGVSVDLVQPGASVRITQISDVVEPRVKVTGSGDVFPGLLGPVESVGTGRTHRLGGAAVVVSGEVPWLGSSGLFVPRDNFLDTSSSFTPHAETANIVVRLDFAEGLTHEDYQRAVVLAGLRAARHLAAVTFDLAPADVAVHDLPGAPPELPRVAYAYQVQSQGVFMRTYLYGRALDELLPTLIHPNELADGALVAGGLGGASVKLTTWLHQNNPLVAGLYARHAAECVFAGVILHRGHYYQYEDKQRVALQIARCAELLGVHGVVFSLGGGGNNITEVMLAIQACERLGIKTVLLAWEHGGPQGTDYPLPFAVPEAVAIVSTGSMDAPLELPAMDRVSGAKTIRIRPELGGVALPVDGPLQLTNRYELFGDANPVGWQHTGCREY